MGLSDLPGLPLDGFAMGLATSGLVGFEGLADKEAAFFFGAGLAAGASSSALRLPLRLDGLRCSALLSSGSGAGGPCLFFALRPIAVVMRMCSERSQRSGSGEQKRSDEQVVPV